MDALWEQGPLLVGSAVGELGEQGWPNHFFHVLKEGGLAAPMMWTERRETPNQGCCVRL